MTSLNPSNGSGHVDHWPRAGRGGDEPIRTPEPITSPRAAVSVRAMTPEATASWNSWFGKGFAAYFERAVDDPDGPVFAVIKRCIGLVLDELNEGLDARIEQLEKRLATMATAAELPQIRSWEPETVTYRGALVTHDGGLWQATRDCATPPGSPDRRMVSRAGRDGVDGRSVTMRGLYELPPSWL
jgi:hypothetical protein